MSPEFSLDYFASTASTWSTQPDNDPEDIREAICIGFKAAASRIFPISADFGRRISSSPIGDFRGVFPAPNSADFGPIGCGHHPIDDDGFALSEEEAIFVALSSDSTRFGRGGERSREQDGCRRLQNRIRPDLLDDKEESSGFRYVKCDECASTSAAAINSDSTSSGNSMPSERSPASPSSDSTRFARQGTRSRSGT